VPHYCFGFARTIFSTKVPTGSRALAASAVYMAAWIYPQTRRSVDGLAEGVGLDRQAPFTTTSTYSPTFGDGTYFHSGILGKSVPQSPPKVSR